MTCNPACLENTRDLIPGQNSTDRHDLTSRVFKVKIQKLVALFTKEDTKTNCKGYPLYRRRSPEDGGHTLTQKTRAKIRKDRNVALGVASSRTAATLLSSGRAISVKTVPVAPCCNNES
ncbi:helitron_like_N domain-containing protein [Trichonephila clavipes]|nr:helitron_like_N domain-containing protein [Trichonephila clavipes]